MDGSRLAGHAGKLQLEAWSAASIRFLPSWLSLSLCVLRILPNLLARDDSDVSPLRAGSSGPNFIAPRIGLSFRSAGALRLVPFVLWSIHADRISAISLHAKS